MFKAALLKTCVAALAAVCLGGVSGLLRAQQTTETRAEDASARPQDASARARVEALRSSDALKRAAAAYELSKRPAEARAAMEALLGLLGDAASVDQRIYRKQDWRNDPYTNTTVGREAAVALTAAGEAAFEPLIAALGRTEDEARRNAAWALGALDDRRAVEPLAKTLGSDSYVEAREQAAWALGAIGDARATEALTRALSDEWDEVREQAAWALGAVGDAHSVGPLIAALKDPHSDVRTQSAWALGAIGDPRAADALRDATRDKNSDVREQARWALGVVGKP